MQVWSSASEKVTVEDETKFTDLVINRIWDEEQSSKSNKIIFFHIKTGDGSESGGEDGENTFDWMVK